MKLELINVDQHKPPITLDQFPVIVGLDPGADVCLDDSSLGHYQCMIDHSDGELMVWDLGTKLGTFVNGQRVSPKAPLRPGDELAFGRSRFVAQYDDGAAQPSRPGDHDVHGGSRPPTPRRQRERPAPVAS
jgi:pSer/pThr/pTyr-binding forkhead associated (FHA) protein